MTPERSPLFLNNIPPELNPDSSHIYFKTEMAKQTRTGHRVPAQLQVVLLGNQIYAFINTNISSNKKNLFFLGGNFGIPKRPPMSRPPML